VIRINSLTHAIIDTTQTIVKLLLEAGANASAQDEYGWTALYQLANRLGSKNQQATLALVRLLLAPPGMDCNAQINYGQTAIHLMSIKSSRMPGIVLVTALEVLLEHGANPAIQDNAGILPRSLFQGP